MKKTILLSTTTAIGFLLPTLSAVALEPTNLDELLLGEKIVGPVGPDVETTFVNGEGEGIGDLSSSVSCPAGFTSCIPPENPAGTVYTYIHEVTPGVDLPNDPPFPSPETVLPIDDARSFQLGFEAAGFNGVAGYSFSEAEAALEGDDMPTVEELEDGRLIWNIPESVEWNAGETISFFWQTSQNPSGPGGEYGLASEEQAGMAAGPLPVPVDSSAVPEPSAIAPLVFLGLGLIAGKGLRDRSFTPE